MGPSLTQPPRTSPPLESVVCNICKEAGTNLLFKIKSFHIVQCQSCGLVYTNPRLTQDKLQSVYDESYFQSDNSLNHGYFDYLSEKDSIQKTFQERWEKIKKISGIQKGSLLDVGCATGFLLDLARNEGWNVKGIDTSAWAVQFAQDKLKLDVTLSDFSDLPFPDQSFDVLVMWDVIEHLPDPTRSLEQCYRKLKPGGILSIITPDQGSLTARLFGKQWVEYQKPHEHLYFFTKSNFSKLLAKLNFSVLWTGTAGKYVPLKFAIERLEAYQHFIFKTLGGFISYIGLGSLTFKVNPMDKMFLIAKKPEANKN